MPPTHPPTPPDPTRIAALLTGLAGGVVLLSGWHAGYALGLGPFPPFDLADLVIRETPGALATWGIESFGRWVQRILLGAGIAAWFLATGGAGLILLRWNTPIARAGSAGALLAAATLPALLLGTWPSGARAPVAFVAVAAPVAGAWLLIASWLNRQRALASQKLADQQLGHWLDAVGDLDRRAFVHRVAGITAAFAIGAAGIGWFARRVGAGAVTTGAGLPLNDAREAAALALGLPTLPAPTPAGTLPNAFAAPADVRPRLTPLRDFYVVDISTRDPVLPEDAWALRISGRVERPLTIGWQDLLALPAVEIYGTLMCISYTYGSDLISTTRWTGVPLRDVLQLAGVGDGVVDVVLRGAHGYSDSIPLGVALRADSLLAYGMDGRTLPRRHGFPCRLYVPSLYGEKNVKWLQSIELVDDDYIGYWQERGWSDVAIVNTIATVDRPRREAILDSSGIVPVGGIAFAGSRGIRAVEVRIDGGPWQAAEVEPYDPRLVWQRWRFDWRPTPGAYDLTVRAIDGNGTPQVETERDPHPDGMTGLDRVTVHVV